ncbi:MAG: YdcF family protein [Treponemataceae bacterium]|nr:YdcF family protein [Treponemataceae bacterium]
MGIFLILLGIISIGYDLTLILLNPGTFMDNLTSFTHIWSVLGAYLVFVGIYRLRKGHSFFSIWKKWIKIIVIGLFSIAISISILNLVFILNPVEASVDEEAEHLILLGGGISKDGSLPATVLRRVEAAAEYLNEHPGCLCVVTGGKLDWLPYAEAPELKKQLVAAGVEADRILVEDKALDTIQNFQFSCELLASYKGISLRNILDATTVIVTSRFHLRRAERLAYRMGFSDIKGISAPCPAIYILHNYVREICAYVKLNLRILLTGKPERIE